MLSVPMRTFPSLFVGQRVVITAEQAPQNSEGSRYVCGACQDELVRADRSFLRDVVVKCRCGEFNQL